MGVGGGEGLGGGMKGRREGGRGREGGDCKEWERRKRRKIVLYCRRLLTMMFTLINKDLITANPGCWQKGEGVQSYPPSPPSRPQPRPTNLSVLAI